MAPRALFLLLSAAVVWGQSSSKKYVPPKTPWASPICKAYGPAMTCTTFPLNGLRNSARARPSPKTS